MTLNTHITDLDLSIRALNTLRYFKIETVNDLMSFDVTIHKNKKIDKHFPHYQGRAVSNAIIKEILEVQTELSNKQINTINHDNTF